MRCALLVLFLVGCTPDSDDTRSPSGIDRDDMETWAFGFPVFERELIYQVTGVDHDPVNHGGDLIGRATCTAYDGDGFPACYDGHRGSDFLLDGGFETMDDGSALVLAAQSGVVIDIRDGEYDRCSFSYETQQVDCDGYPERANYVIVDHGDGIEAYYWHLKNGSVNVEIGDEIECGHTLGKIGSSGTSSFPHLHFEVRVDGEVLDPYAGPFSQPASWWAEQDDEDGLPGAGCTAD